MSPLQQKVYEFIRDSITEHEFSPTLEEIATGIGISPRSVSLISRCVHALVQSGKLRFYKKGYRNIQVVNKQDSFSLPLLGRIAAGSPIEAIHDQQSLDFSPLLQPANHFVLEVKGDSMIEEGILDGDFVICKSVTTAAEGDIVVALINQTDTTLKRLSYKIKDKITLIPANPALKPRSYLPDRIQIQGVFIGLVRLKNKAHVTQTASSS